MSSFRLRLRAIAARILYRLAPPPPPAPVQTLAIAGGIVEVIQSRHGLMLVPRADTTIGEALRRYGEWAESEMTLMAAFIPSGGTVLEVGANLGSHTLAFSRLAGPEGRVIALEPQRFIHACLSGSIALNGCQNVRAFNAFAGDHTGSFLPPTIDYAETGNFGAVHFRNVASAARSFETIQMICADDLDIPRLDLVKIDAEGMEAEVLQGMAKTLDRLKPAVFAEATSQDRSAAVEAILRPLGYRGWMVRAPAYNPANFRADSFDIFGGATETNILYLTEAQAGLHAALIRNLPEFRPELMAD
ncbi:MAG: FkbM family methyltransferase [Alphaproteobacteria bacterium]|nr:FkbM family methyltransferase [Alphaproteobacteria bacterium]MBU0797948.1 FkbM family methyltransferase [Alphaproteobacteria bacterium]MBU0886100.1 FkbM family methyltransferase [Alphaproteobacteria bacterium]MBU1812740.1 FkbM family methyltransferase [Alphaproteobacteria bacterium]MBU2091897.1 FkbM family methyltransferase [Alphaproteobacteria bacterium]